MILTVVAKLLLYAGVTLAAGDVALRFWRVFAQAGTFTDHIRATVHRAWFALWSAALLLLAVQGRDLELGLAWRDYAELLRGTAWGRSWLLLATSILVGHAAFRWRWHIVVQALAMIVIAASMSGLGHAAADATWPIAARVIDTVHVLGVSAWLGGLYVVWRRAPHEHQGDAWSAFSRVATVAAPLVVLTGFAAALLRTSGSSLGATISSDYGRLLIVKVLLASVVLGFGATHRQRTVERRVPGARTVQAELAFTVLVFLVTSILTGTPPPGE